jgi:hypothetical protein
VRCRLHDSDSMDQKKDLSPGKNSDSQQPTTITPTRTIDRQRMERSEMADIKQAARWMDKGLEVRRPSFGATVTVRATAAAEIVQPRDDGGGWIIFQYDGDPVSHNLLTIDDLLADDWELA